MQEIPRLDIPGYIDEKDLATIQPLFSLNVAPGQKLDKYVQEQDESWIKTPMIPSKGLLSALATPRANNTRTVPSVFDPVQRESQVSEDEILMGIATSGPNDYQASGIAQDTNRYVNEMGSAHSQTPLHTQDEWTLRDGNTYSIYDAYLEPLPEYPVPEHEAAREYQNMPFIPNDTMASASSSVSSITSSLQGPRRVDVLLDPSEDAENRLLTKSADSTYISANSHMRSSQDSSQASVSRVDGVPMAITRSERDTSEFSQEEPYMRASTSSSAVSQPVYMLADPAMIARGHESVAPAESALQSACILSDDADLFSCWTSFLMDGHASRNINKAIEMVDFGVPAPLRGRIWLLLAGKKMRPVPGLYASLVAQSQTAMRQQPPHQFAVLIENDLDMCFPLSKSFQGIGGSTRDDIRLVLHAYAHHNPAVGYTESMCLLVGMLLVHVSVEDAFWLLDAIMVHYGMGKYYTGNLDQLQVDNLVVDEHLRIVDNELHNKFKELRIEPLLFMPGWILPMFVRTLPWSTLLRVWDNFFCYGEHYMVKTAISVILLNRNVLLRPSQSHDREAMLHHLVFVTPSLVRDKVVLDTVKNIQLSDKELSIMQRNASGIIPDQPQGHKSSKPRFAMFRGKPVLHKTKQLLLRRK
ncbi:hypothetical protein MVES_003569 [Malassezia vespertilionis]|uniref:Rab-GAP TBC domain-containing protein n=2 Tax=Malassezia vespertilionis TaxID=2020962 RepID=A0A2N1J732_9BASI|nr:hypothetical protein MVES_003569 [Malassezia vespertilionis]